MSGALAASQARLPPRAVRRIGLARILDAAVIAVVLASVLWLIVRANAALGYRWDWGIIPTYLVRTNPATGARAPNILMLGFFTTVRLAVLSLICGTFVGAIFASMLVYGRPAFRWLARGFVELVRDMPPIVLIFILYFFVSSQIMSIFGLTAALNDAPPWARNTVSILLATPDRIDDFLSGLACLSLLSGAYITEIVRAGLQSVPNAQLEAGRALGLRGWPVFRLVILPQALHNVLPALAAQFIVSIKDSSLVSLISIQELTFMTSEISSTTQKFFEPWLFTAAVYFSICFCCSALFRSLEHRRGRFA